MANRSPEVRRITDKLARFRKYREQQKSLLQGNTAVMVEREAEWDKQIEAVGQELAVLARAGNQDAVRALRRNGLSDLLGEG